jgi:nucleotide-binding universal stress UspA family protein
MIEYKNVLFCTDFSDDANIAFLHAVNLCKRYGAKLHILHVPHSPYTYARNLVDEHLPEKSQAGEAVFDEEIARKAEDELRKTYGGKLEGLEDCKFVIQCGAPDVEIIRYANRNAIDVIVMGSLGKAELDRMVHGSTVANVSRYAHCHVMAIRNPAKQFTLPGKMV